MKWSDAISVEMDLMVVEGQTEISNMWKQSDEFPKETGNQKRD